MGLIYVKVKLKVQRLLRAAPSPSLPSPFQEDEAGRNPEGTEHLHSMVPNSKPLAYSLFHHKVGTPLHPPPHPHCSQECQELSEATTDAQLRDTLALCG